MTALSIIEHSVTLPPAFPDSEIAGLYLHVPFCFHKCHYCDFYSITRQTPERMDAFVGRILSEADQWKNGQRGPLVAPTSIFLGGGTPSLLPMATMQQLLAGLQNRFDLSRVSEWTVEVNPATVDFDYCRMLLDSGVNRISMGAQSFSKAELSLLERHHDPDDVVRSLDFAAKAGFTRLNLDLIFAIPGQTMDSWQRTLETAIALRTPHISCYALTYETNTAITVRKRLGHFQPVEEDIELQMLHYTRDRLTAEGILPYEISNFAITGEACRHNVNYWMGGNYVGLGPSAASHVEGWRWKNRSHLAEWEQAVDRNELPVVEAEELTPRQRANELAMLMLRLDTGIVLTDFQRKTGLGAAAVFSNALERLSKMQLIEISPTAIKLTRAGLNVADAIAGEFLNGD